MIYASRLNNPKSVLESFEMEFEHFGNVLAPAGFMVEKATGVNKVDEDNRSVSGVANVLSISRSMIKVSIEGMNLAEFHNNPVVLAGHRQISPEMMPGAIGTIEQVSKANKKSELRFKNMRFDTDPLAEAWYQKVLSGTIRMVSVGFIPQEYSVQSEVVGSGKTKREIYYLDITESELVEISVVPIGANRGAMFGQGASEKLMQRIEAAEQKADSLLKAIKAFMEGEKESATEQAKSRLLSFAKKIME